MKIARYHVAGGDFYIVREVVADDRYIPDDYTRVSEIVEVEFTELPKESVIENQLGVLDRVEAKLRTEFQRHLDALNTQRANLRALTFQA